MRNIGKDLPEEVEKGIAANEELKIELNDEFTKGHEATSYPKKEILQNLVSYLTISSDYDSKEINEKEFASSDLLLSEGVVIKQWRNIENISARLIEFNEITVVLECLVDREELIYEEREFKSSLFSQFNLELGKLFKLCMYERQNQIMMEIKDNPKLISETDFPKIDFAKQFKNFKIKKSN